MYRRNRLASWINRARTAADADQIVATDSDGTLSVYSLPATAQECREVAEQILDELGDDGGSVQCGKARHRVRSIVPPELATDEPVSLAAAAAKVPVALQRHMAQTMRHNEALASNQNAMVSTMVDHTSTIINQATAMMAEVMGTYRELTAMHLDAVKAREQALNEAAERRALAEERETVARMRERWLGHLEDLAPHVVRRLKYGKATTLHQLTELLLGLSDEQQGKLIEILGPDAIKFIREITDDGMAQAEDAAAQKRAAE